jgi:hypothetical protein
MNRSERRKMQKVLHKHNYKLIKRKSIALKDIYIYPKLKTPNPMFDSKLFLDSIVNKNFDFSVDETCCLCNAEIKDFRDSHNPYPLAINSSDRCCSVCNNTVVLDARLSLIKDCKEKKEELVN